MQASGSRAAPAAEVVFLECVVTGTARRAQIAQLVLPACPAADDVVGYGGSAEAARESDLAAVSVSLETGLAEGLPLGCVVVAVGDFGRGLDARGRGLGDGLADGAEARHGQRLPSLLHRPLLHEGAAGSSIPG